MCCTAVLLENTHKIKIMTTPLAENVIHIETFQCDESWKPSVLLGTGQQAETEYDYHRKVREGAIKANTFIPSESTNPEVHEGLIEEPAAE